MASRWVWCIFQLPAMIGLRSFWPAETSAMYFLWSRAGHRGRRNRRAEQLRCDQSGRLLFHGLGYVGIHVEGDRDLAMAEPVAHHLRVDAGFEGGGRPAVAKIVGPYRPDTGLPGDAPQRPAHILWVDRRSVLSGEDQVLVAVQATPGEPLFELGDPVAAQDGHGGWVKSDGPLRLRRLRLPGEDLPADPADGVTNGQAPGVDVDIRPSQPEHLAATHPG